MDALQIWRVSLPNGNVSPLTNDLSNYFTLSLASDGKTLAAVRMENSSGLWVTRADDLSHSVPVSSSNLRSLNDISWTRDGRIAYSARAGDSLSIFLTDTTAEHPKHLSVDRRNRLETTVTRDGRYFLFQLGGKIWRMNSDGSAPR